MNMGVFRLKLNPSAEKRLMASQVGMSPSRAESRVNPTKSMEENISYQGAEERIGPGSQFSLA